MFSVLYMFALVHCVGHDRWKRQTFVICAQNGSKIHGTCIHFVHNLYKDHNQRQWTMSPVLSVPSAYNCRCATRHLMCYGLMRQHMQRNWVDSIHSLHERTMENPHAILCSSFHQRFGINIWDRIINRT